MPPGDRAGELLQADGSHPRLRVVHEVARVKPLLGSGSTKRRADMSHDVFISYAQEDQKFADTALAKMEANGLRCWIAHRDIVPGSDWSESIVQAIEESRVMVLVFSTSANESAQIKREIERSVDKGVPILPVRLEDVLPSGSLEYFISSQHWLDAITPPVEAHLDQLCETVRRLIDTPEEEKESRTARPRTSALAPGKDGPRKGRMLGVGAVLAALAIAWFVLGRSIRVESVKGLQAEEADAVLAEQGLVARVMERKITGQPIGSVLSQDPAAGQEVEKESEVRLTVEAVSVVVPDLSAFDRDAARSAIADLDLSAQLEDRITDGTRPAGSFLMQEPLAGDRVAPGTTISVAFERASFLLPEGLPGRLASEAERSLDGVKVVKTEVVDFQKKVGTVLELMPPGGTRVPTDSEVTLKVSGVPKEDRDSATRTLEALRNLNRQAWSAPPRRSALESLLAKIDATANTSSDLEQRLGLPLAGTDVVPELTRAREELSKRRPMLEQTLDLTTGNACTSIEKWPGASFAKENDYPLAQGFLMPNGRQVLGVQLLLKINAAGPGNLQLRILRALPAKKDRAEPDPVSLEEVTIGRLSVPVVNGQQGWISWDFRSAAKLPLADQETPYYLYLDSSDTSGVNVSWYCWQPGFNMYGEDLGPTAAWLYINWGWDANGNSLRRNFTDRYCRIFAR